mgnify:CR=1 FL=1
MNKIIIGCDPDSSKSGFAIYINGKLDTLGCMTLVEFYEYLNNDNLPTITFDNVELHIENVNGISSNSFSVNKKDSLPVKLKKAEHVGKCKQAQTEIERIAENFGIKVIHHPISKQWKKNKGIFEKLTGWTGRSNEDSRSGAYMGYLGLTQSK